MVRSRVLRAALARWGRATRGMTLGVRALVFDEVDRVMLVRHGYAPGWHLPGGAVEVGETAEIAAVRELFEETGLEALGRPSLVGLYFNRAFGGRDHVALFQIDRFERRPEPAPNREIAERGWFPIDALPEGATAATRRRLDEVLRGAQGDGLW
jgi:ADP-ribose pyrophosphatase YjhB (NUDIX family)